jgi:hypothetical protein
MPASTPDENTASVSSARVTIRSIVGSNLSASSVHTEVQKRNQTFDSSHRTKMMRLRAITKNFSEVHAK